MIRLILCVIILHFTNTVPVTQKGGLLCHDFKCKSSILHYENDSLIYSLPWNEYDDNEINNRREIPNNFVVETTIIPEGYLLGEIYEGKINIESSICYEFSTDIDCINTTNPTQSEEFKLGTSDVQVQKIIDASSRYTLRYNIKNFKTSILNNWGKEIRSKTPYLTKIIIKHSVTGLGGQSCFFESTLPICLSSGALILK